MIRSAAAATTECGMSSVFGWYDAAGRVERQFTEMPDDKKERYQQQESKKNAKKESLLQTKLTRLAVQIGYAGTVAGVLCFLGLLTRFCIEARCAVDLHNRSRANRSTPSTTSRGPRTTGTTSSRFSSSA